MNNLKNEKGITLVALVVTIIVILIIAGISLSQGTDLIKKAKAETFVTNMITIRANAKVYAEEINAKTWGLGESEKQSKVDELFANDYGMVSEADINGVPTSDIDIDLSDGATYKAYSLTSTALEDMGLESEKDDDNYMVVFDSADYTKLDVVYKDGVVYEGKTYYTLSSLKEAIEE